MERVTGVYHEISCAESIGGPQEKRLLGSLLSDYNSLNRPVLNESEALMLTFGVTLQQIIDVVSTTSTGVKRRYLEIIIFLFPLDYFLQITRK
jgi:hypothetical protein